MNKGLRIPETLLKMDIKNKQLTYTYLHTRNIYLSWHKKKKLNFTGHQRNAHDINSKIQFSPTYLTKSTLNDKLTSISIYIPESDKLPKLPKRVVHVKSLKKNI